MKQTMKRRTSAAVATVTVAIAATLGLGALAAPVRADYVQVTAFGHGDPQLEQPEGIAVSPFNGDFYVTEQEGQSNASIDEFHPDGSFVRSFGHAYDASSAESIEFDTIDNQGEVFVTDRPADSDGVTDGRIQKYSAGGSFLGTPLHVHAQCTVGEVSVYLDGLALDRVTGTLYSTYGYEPNAQQCFGGQFLNSDYKIYARKDGKLDKWGGQGSGKSQFDQPLGLAVGPLSPGTAGKVFRVVWVADSGNHRVQEDFTGGGYIQSFGPLIIIDTIVDQSRGATAAELASPYGVALDSKGHVFVSDPPAHRVYKFSSKGRALTFIPVSDPSGIVVHNGHLFVLDRHTDQVLDFVDVRPSTEVTSGPANNSMNNPSTVTLRFKADQPARFQCKLDRHGWRGCKSPDKLTRLSNGWHAFQVRAVDAEGLRDQDWAKLRFQVHQ